MTTRAQHRQHRRQREMLFDAVGQVLPRHLHLPDSAQLARTRRSMRDVPVPNSLVRLVLRALQAVRQVAYVDSVSLAWSHGSEWVIGRGEHDQTKFTVDERGLVEDRPPPGDITAGQVVGLVVDRLLAGDKVVRMHLYRIGDLAALIGGDHDRIDYLVGAERSLLHWTPMPYVPRATSHWEEQDLQRQPQPISNLTVRRRPT